MQNSFKFILALIGLFLFSDSFSQEIVQWRGPNRDGQFPAENLLKKWPENGPKQILKVDSLGKGHSSVIYSEGIMYITGMKDTLDYLSAIDMSGKIIWQMTYGTSWRRSFPDTRSTPTLYNGKLYVVSGVGELVCVNAIDGKEIWNVNVDKEFEGEWSRFGVSESPLIIDNLVICSPGGEKTSIVAFNAENGELAWQSKSVGGKRIYSSPTIYKVKKKQYILALTNQNLICLNPKDGSIRWTFKNDTATGFKAGPYTNTPVYVNNEIFMSHGYNYPAMMIEVSKKCDAATLKWTDTIFDNHHHGYVYHEGYIYGTNWENNKIGNWICMEWETGKITYNEKWGTKGTIISADGMFYIYEEKTGNIGLLKPNPEKFELISSFKISEGNGPHWSHLSIYDGKLFARHGEVLMVYDIEQK